MGRRPPVSPIAILARARRRFARRSALSSDGGRLVRRGARTRRPVRPPVGRVTAAAGRQDRVAADRGRATPSHSLSAPTSTAPPPDSLRGSPSRSARRTRHGTRCASRLTRERNHVSTARMSRIARSRCTGALEPGCRARLTHAGSAPGPERPRGCGTSLHMARMRGAASRRAGDPTPIRPRDAADDLRPGDRDLAGGTTTDRPLPPPAGIPTALVGVSAVAERDRRRVLAFADESVVQCVRDERAAPSAHSGTICPGGRRWAGALDPLPSRPARVRPLSPGRSTVGRPTGGAEGPRGSASFRVYPRWRPAQ
jgi:hypothetical protein